MGKLTCNFWSKLRNAGHQGFRSWCNTGFGNWLYWYFVYIISILSGIIGKTNTSQYWPMWLALVLDGICFFDEHMTLHSIKDTYTCDLVDLNQITNLFKVIYILGIISLYGMEIWCMYIYLTRVSEHECLKFSTSFI